MKSANGVLILVLGILSIVGFGCFTGLPAWIMGNSALKDIDAGRADPSERGLVLAGKIMGIISTVITLLLACFWLIAIAGIFGLAAAGASHSVR